MSHHTTRKMLLAASIVFGGLVSASTANAAKMGVRVLDASSGLPVPKASVCLGTADQPTLYGTGVTSFDGVALYDNVPDKSMLITVSKRNYRGISLRKVPRGDNVVVDVTVTEGLSSKKCRALKLVDLKPGITAEKQAVEWPLKIMSQSYFPAGKDGMSFLTSSMGKPTHYRVSTDKLFRGAEWRVYSDIMHFSPRRADLGKTTLYFQLRKRITVEGGAIDAVSAVTSRPVAIGNS